MGRTASDLDDLFAAADAQGSLTKQLWDNLGGQEQFGITWGSAQRRYKTREPLDAAPQTPDRRARKAATLPNPDDREGESTQVQARATRHQAAVERANSDRMREGRARARARARARWWRPRTWPTGRASNRRQPWSSLGAYSGSRGRAGGREAAAYRSASMPMYLHYVLYRSAGRHFGTN